MPTLGRPFLKELPWVETAGHPAIAGFLDRWIGDLQQLIGDAERTGEICVGEDRALAILLADMLLAGMRRWLAGQIDRAALGRQLDVSLRLLLEGIARSPVPARDQRV